MIRIGDAELHHCDCRALAFGGGDVVAVVSDPPYGIGYRVNARKRRNTSLDRLSSTLATAARPPIAGDCEPFDPRPWLPFPRVALFGANNFADRLPTGGKWIVWDKRRDSAPDAHSDCELVWTNVPGSLRIHRQKWRGIVREGEENLSRQRKVHPNQKPVALLRFLFAELGLCRGDTVLDPYMGSGSTGVAALSMGLRFIGVEIDRAHFDTAVARIQQAAAEAAMRLAV